MRRHIDKQKIIDLAFLKLGEQTQLYHSNITDRMNIADVLFEDVIDSLATDATFLFNSRTIELTKQESNVNSRGEYKYNKPNDYLSRVWSSDRNIRIENEFIYSKEENVELCYCFRMNLSDYPIYLQALIVPKLAKRIAETYDGYYNKIPILEREIIDETNKIITQEGIPFGIIM